MTSEDIPNVTGSLESADGPTRLDLQDGRMTDLRGEGASEIVAGLAPGARVVKAFNSIVIERFNEGPAKNGGRRVIFVSGDDAEPKELIKGLIKSFGFEPVDLGGLVTGGRLQQAGGPLAGHDLVDFGYH